MPIDSNDFHPYYLEMHPFVGRAVAGITIGGAAVWGISGIDSTSRDETGAIVEAGELGAFVTQVGDCFNFNDPSESLVSVIDGVPCSSPHRWQVFYKFEITQNSFIKEVIMDEAQGVCEQEIPNIFQQLSTKKLQDYENSYVITLTPTFESFDEGDRTVDCLVGSDAEFYTTSLLD